MKVTVKLPPPHSDIQNMVFQHLANPDGPRGLWLSCGTKFGKTMSGACGTAYALPKRRGQTGRWIAPIYRQTKIGWGYLKKMLPGKPYTDFKQGEMILNIPSRDTNLEFLHGQHPEDLEGSAIHFQVNDEASKLKEQVWVSSNTTWTQTRAKYINMSTPRGKKNWFYRGCKKAREEEKRAKREGRPPKEIFRTAPTQSNPYVPAESILEAKDNLPARLYDQYYRAIFVDDGMVFPSMIIDDDLTGGLEVESKQDSIHWLVSDHDKRTVVAGIDWAKTRDYTWVIAIDYVSRPFKVVGILRFPHGIKYTEQVVRSVKFLRKFKSCDMCYHDKTGVGNAVDDLLDAVPNFVYEGFTFSNASKALMVNDLITGHEKEEIVYPNCPTLKTEFEEFEVITDDLGRMRFEASEGHHDDGVVATMLSYAAAKQYSESDFEVKFLEDIDVKSFDKDTWENYVYESLDIDPDEGF